MIVITGIGLAFCFFEGRLFLRLGLFDPPLFLCPKLFLLFCLRLLAGLAFRLFCFRFDPRLLIDLGLIFDKGKIIVLYRYISFQIYLNSKKKLKYLLLLVGLLFLDPLPFFLRPLEFDLGLLRFLLPLPFLRALLLFLCCLFPLGANFEFPLSKSSKFFGLGGRLKLQKFHISIP